MLSFTSDVHAILILCVYNFFSSSHFICSPIIIKSNITSLKHSLYPVAKYTVHRRRKNEKKRSDRIFTQATINNSFQLCFLPLYTMRYNMFLLSVNGITLLVFLYSLLTALHRHVTVEIIYNDVTIE